MSSEYYEHVLEEETRAADAEWARTPEGRATMMEFENCRLREEMASLEREKAQRRQECEWKQAHPAEWRAWRRLQPMLAMSIAFSGEEAFDFESFRKEVGEAPRGVGRVVRKDRSLPYQQGNLRWGRPRAALQGPRVSGPAAPRGPQSARGAEQNDYMTKAEVAALLRVSTRSVNRWVSRGFLKPFRRGQVLRFKREDVEAFEAKGRNARR